MSPHLILKARAGHFGGPLLLYKNQTQATLWRLHIFYEFDGILHTIWRFRSIIHVSKVKEDILCQL